jgi:sugar-specific transcriptional regulator TrmB
MRSQGLVDITVERPRRFVATPPSVLLERVLRRRRETLERDEGTAREIVEAFERFGADEGGDTARYQIVTGTSRVWEHFREMIGRAREEIAVLSTARGLRDAFRVDLHHSLGPLLERGGRFRLLAESDPKIHGLLERFSTLAERYPQAEVRQLAPQPSRVTIVDRSEAIVFLVPDAHIGPLEQIAVWTNHPDFVAGQMTYFKAMWERAGSGSLRPPTPASTGRTPPRARASRRATGATPRSGTGSTGPPPRA